MPIDANKLPSSVRSEKSIKNVLPTLNKELSVKSLSLGANIYIRIFKQEDELEVWLKDKNSKHFKLFKTYPICTFSGSLGPKLKEGDHQSPEGFYFVKPNQMNPYSQFHLSFNLGYPNAYDRYHKRTGSALMVHGNCVSIGCYAMTDPLIEEIYALANAALKGGQKYFRVHAFPFRMNSLNMDLHKHNKWHSFWLNLKDGYDFFEKNKFPPNVTVANGVYQFD